MVAIFSIIVSTRFQNDLYAFKNKFFKLFSRSSIIGWEVAFVLFSKIYSVFKGFKVWASWSP